MAASVTLSFAQSDKPFPPAPNEIVISLDNASGPSMSMEELKKTKSVVVFQQDYEIVSFSMIIMTESKGGAPINLYSSDSKLTKQQIEALSNCAKGDRIALEPVVIRKKGTTNSLHAHGAIYTIM